MALFLSGNKHQGDTSLILAGIDVTRKRSLTNLLGI